MRVIIHFFKPTECTVPEGTIHNYGFGVIMISWVSSSVVTIVPAWCEMLIKEEVMHVWGVRVIWEISVLLLSSAVI